MKWHFTPAVTLSLRQNLIESLGVNSYCKNMWISRQNILTLHNILVIIIQIILDLIQFMV